MQAARELKRKIDGGEITIGVLATDWLSPMLVEVAQRAGLDYIIVDREHGPHDDSLVAQVCQLGRLMQFPVLMRVVSTAPDIVRRAMDLGPCGLMFPHVESTAQLDEARAAMLMPPRGGRRPGGWANYWLDDFQYETWRTEVEADLIVLPQIESQRGVDNAEAIARHELVTAMAIGPYDLSADLGCCWRPEAPELKAAIAAVRAAGRAAGKNTWFGMGGRALVDDGWTFICLGSPTYLLTAALRQQVTAARD